VKYNDGTGVELEKFNQTARELSARFGGLTQEVVLSQGMWQHKGKIYEDESLRIRVDSGDPEAVAFLRKYKRTLKERFKQLDIWITAHELEII
jgi:hypothetical protein